MITIQCSLRFRAACICIWAASALLAQQNLTVTGSQCSTSQQAVNSITTSGTCTVSGSASVKFEAGGSIVLMPGFHAQASGSNIFDVIVVPQAVAPALASPASGASGPALSPQTFTLTFSDTLGAADISSFQASFGGTGATAGICSLSYSGGVLGLWSNDASQLYTTPPLQNNQCSIGNYTVSNAGNTSTFTVSITFLTSFEGSQELYALGVSSSGDYHPWVDLGAWTVTAPTTQTQIFSSPGTYTWTAPTGVTSIQVEGWGPGGNGANAAYFYPNGYMAGGGGGGGAYAKKTSAAVTPGQSYTIVVGAAGSATKSTFAGNVAAADYGINGAQATGYCCGGLGGSGGQASNSVGDVLQSGGNGGNAPGAPYGGSGGAGANGGPGGYGGMFAPYGNGTPGSAPGGGGGGGASGGAYAGGAGGNGQIVLTYAGLAGGVTYSITGQVTASGAPLSQATMALTGSQTATVSTDTNGNYGLFNLTGGGNYTVTASKSGYSLSAPRTYTNLATNQIASFMATQVTTYTISGQVTVAGSGLSGVTIALTGSQTGTAATDGNGNYSFSNLAAGGTYTVTASKSGYAVSTAQTFTNLAANQTANFTATVATTYTISGQVTLSGTGSGLSGVSIALSGSQTANTTTDANGNYSLPNLATGGNYMVTASKNGYSFSGAQTFSNLAANQTANFTGALGQYTATSLADLTNNCLPSSTPFPICALAPGTYDVTSTIKISRSNVTLTGGSSDRSQTVLLRHPSYPAGGSPGSSNYPMIQVDAATPLSGVTIQNLIFCGGSYPGNPAPSSFCASAYQTAGLGDPQGQTTCGQWTQEANIGANPAICVDLEIDHADTGLNPTDPFNNLPGSYSLTINNVDLEDAGGHALQLFGSAWTGKKVNDVYIHNSAINSSGVTGILHGATSLDFHA